MREIVFFVASLAGAAILTALAVLNPEASLLWKNVQGGGIAILAICALLLFIDIIRRRWPKKQKMFFSKKNLAQQKTIIVRLSNFYSESDQLLRRLVTSSVSDHNYAQLQADIEQWSRNLECYIDHELGIAVKSRMLEMSVDVRQFRPASGYQDDIATLWALTVTRKNLLAIIDGLSARLN